MWMIDIVFDSLSISVQSNARLASIIHLKVITLLLTDRPFTLVSSCAIVIYRILFKIKRSVKSNSSFFSLVASLSMTPWGIYPPDTFLWNLSLSVSYMYNTYGTARLVNESITRIIFSSLIQLACGSTGFFFQTN